jgi:hypothetical protein
LPAEQPAGRPFTTEMPERGCIPLTDPVGMEHYPLAKNFHISYDFSRMA